MEPWKHGKWDPRSEFFILLHFSSLKFQSSHMAWWLLCWAMSTDLGHSFYHFFSSYFIMGKLQTNTEKRTV